MSFVFLDALLYIQPKSKEKRKCRTHCVGPRIFAPAVAQYLRASDGEYSWPMIALTAYEAHPSTIRERESRRKPATRALASQESGKTSAQIYAARFSDTIGRCRLPSWKHTSISKQSPGCPAMSVRGLAHGEGLGQRSRGSIRSRWCENSCSKVPSYQGPQE